MNQLDGEFFGVVGLCIALIVGFFVLRVLFWIVLTGIVVTISTIFGHMIYFTRKIWMPIGKYAIKAWWLFTKGAAIAILIIGFLWIIGQGHRVTDAFYAGVSVGKAYAQTFKK